MMSFVGFCEFQRRQSKGKRSNVFLKISANYRLSMGRKMHSNVSRSTLLFILCFINAKLGSRKRK